MIAAAAIAAKIGAAVMVGARTGAAADGTRNER
jgi:biotin carboxylase